MPEKIIYNDGSIRKNSWKLIETSAVLTLENLPQGDLILPLEFWQSNREALKQRQGKLGVWLESSTVLEDITDPLSQADLIAINFPVFTDGRGYSTARLLRERYGYQGDIRAIGDVLQDQLGYMRRCGFDSYKLKEGRCIESAAKALFPFKETYQAAVDQPDPYYRRNQG